MKSVHSSKAFNVTDAVTVHNAWLVTYLCEIESMILMASCQNAFIIIMGCFKNVSMLRKQLKHTSTMLKMHYFLY